MTLTSPSRSQQSYRHEAMLWHDPADFTAGLVPFIEEGLEAGEPVMARALICELTDDLTVTDPLVGLRAPVALDPDGHWAVNQLGDLVQVRSTAAGTTVRVYTWT